MVKKLSFASTLRHILTLIAMAISFRGFLDCKQYPAFIPHKAISE